jgi:uncharacterized protein YqiB (DUF1249 family)
MGATHAPLARRRPGLYSPDMSVTMRLGGWTPRARPVGIGALHELYERNFRLIECLAPELDLPFDDAVSYSGTDLPLRLTVLERGRYTAAFRLTYEFAEAGGPRLDPDLQVRVYRDARLAEALSRPIRPAWLATEEGDPQALQYLDEQWSRNLLLHKWLDYLLGHGHGFGLAARPRARNATPG